MIYLSDDYEDTIATTAERISDSEVEILDSMIKSRGLETRSELIRMAWGLQVTERRSFKGESNVGRAIRGNIG